METLLYSPERLKTPEKIEIFKQFFRRHGALGYGEAVERTLSEFDKINILPLVFGLLPRKILARTRYDDRIKPAIEQHLDSLGVNVDDELVTMLKNIGDQFYLTANKQASWFPRKYGMKDVRALKRVYRSLLVRQNSRCSICGVPFDGKVIETLDHVIPWRLIGDIQDGCNWQILCEYCNQGKGHQLTMLQFKEYWNWIYASSGLSGGANRLSLEMRFVVLARDEKCTHEGCNSGPLAARLYVQSMVPTALPVFDALTVKCELHTRVPRDCLQDHS